MLTINIIPKQYKNEADLKKLYFSLKKILATLFAISLLYSGIFFAEKTILQNHFNDFAEESIIYNQESENYNNQVKNINSQIDFIETIQTDNIIWSNFLIDLSSKIPNGINLSKLNLNKANNVFLIAGSADTRDNLLTLKETLENYVYLDDVSLPLKNLFEKQNINFEITAKFNSYDFIQL